MHLSILCILCINGKVYYAITSRDARENDATQTSEVSKYQI